MTRKERDEKLMAYYKQYAKDEGIPLHEVRKDLNREWGNGGCFGYALFNGGGEPCAVHICRIDEMDIYESDLEAAKFAEMDKLVTLIPKNEVKHNRYFEYWRYIDTPENRKVLKDEGGLKC